MSELDKTIEELEAEVQQELEEASQDAPTKGAAKGESMDKVEGEVQDLGGAGEETPEAESGSAKAGDKIKKATDAQTKGAKDAGGDTEATKIKEPLAAGDDNIDNDGEELQEKAMTKVEMLKAMTDKMEMMKATELKAMYNKMEMMGKEEEEEKAEAKVEESTLDERIASVDVSDDVSALTQDAELSEEFKEKATTIFTAAVSSKIEEETKRLEESYAAQLNEQIDVIKEEMSSKVDSFLNYIVEQWINDNKLAINEGIRTEIAESFMSALKGVFEEHYMDIPEEKYDMVEGMSNKLDEMETKLNEQIEKNIELNSALGEFVKESIVVEVSKGLADTQKEKLSSLAEGVEFTDEESYREKIETIKENYFPKTQITESVEASEPVVEKEIPAHMAAYVSAIARYNK